MRTLPTLPVEFNYAVRLIEPEHFNFCVLSARAPTYTSQELTNRVLEFNKDIDYMTQQDGEERWSLPDPNTCSTVGLFKREIGLGTYEYVYLFGDPLGFTDTIELFKSTLTYQSMMFNESIYRRQISKLGIFLIWLAEKDKWEHLSAVMITPSLTKISGGFAIAQESCKLYGVQYERGVRTVCGVQLYDDDSKFEITLKEYIQKEEKLKELLKNAGGVKTGAHLIPEYLIQMRLNDNLTPKQFEDLATQTQILLDGWGIQLPPLFEKYCKLSGIIL